MKRAAHRSHKVRVALRDLEHAALQGNFADTFDDRVCESGSLFDCEDEREAVEAVEQRTIRTVN